MASEEEAIRNESTLQASPQESEHESHAMAVRLRVWPVVPIVALMWVAFTVPPLLYPESAKGFFPLFLGLSSSYLLFLLWWLLLSRAPWRDRLAGLLLVVGGIVGGSLLAYHPSMLGLPTLFYIMPCVMTAVATALIAAQAIGWRQGRWLALVVALLAIVAPGLLRYDGVNSNFNPKFSSRWTMSDEERLVASLDSNRETPVETASQAEDDAPPLAPNDWPGFRGPNRDGHVLDGALAGDWQKSPPKQLWRKPVGPGWGSFCVVGDRLFTQEQRGEQECVVAYSAATGDQLWSVGVEARFSESIAGPGPRATPTYFEGDLFTLGAAGELQRLDAATGSQHWQRNVLDDHQMQTPPEWGLASSPLLRTLDDGRTLVYLYVCDYRQGVPGSGKLAAYDAATGEPAWGADTGYHSYSSPHLVTLSGVPQVIISTCDGLDSFDLATGDRLWRFAWEIGPFARSTQPLVVDDSRLILSAGYDSGTMVIRVTNNEEGWQAEELWPKPSRDLEPYFNDSVLHDGHLYGIHKKFLVSVNLETGKPTWPRKVKRKTKLGNGQLVLDAASGLLLVTTEDTGEVLLVEASPETFVVRARFNALSAERNWNHPVVAGGRLFVRHGSEAACYELPAP